jgi:hypothetical protein
MPSQALSLKNLHLEAIATFFVGNTIYRSPTGKQYRTFRSPSIYIAIGRFGSFSYFAFNGDVYFLIGPINSASINSIHCPETTPIIHSPASPPKPTRKSSLRSAPHPLSSSVLPAAGTDSSPSLLASAGHRAYLPWSSPLPSSGSFSRGLFRPERPSFPTAGRNGAAMPGDVGLAKLTVPGVEGVPSSDYQSRFVNSNARGDISIH